MRINYKTPRLRFPDFNEPFKKYRLGEISSMFSGATPLTHNKSYYDGDIPFIKSGEISSNITMQFLSQEGLNNSSAKQVIKGDLLYALYGATSGEVAISKINGAINQAVLCIRSSEFLNMYMVELLKLKKKDIVKKYLQGGQGNLSAEIIKSFEVYIPSLDEQITIASFFELINSKIETQEQIIENLEQLKKGYMQKIFSQQLRFKDENGEDFPEWEEMTFDEAISRGLIKKINPSELLPFDGNKTYLSTSSIDRYGICGDDGVVEYNTKPSRASMYPYNGSVWFAKMKDSLKVYKADEEAESKYILSTGFYGFIPNPDLLDGEFLRQTFLSENFNLQKNQYSYGTTMAALNDEGLYAIAIIVPVLNEQKKIADMLMSIDSKIDTEKQILKNLHELKKGYLQQMFI